jgi:hypothetical protein
LPTPGIPPFLSHVRDPDGPYFNAATTAHSLFFYLAVMMLSTGAFIFMVIYLAVIVLARRAAR